VVQCRISFSLVHEDWVIRLTSKQVRRYFAPISVVILILAATFAFLSLQGTYTGPPAILDPNFSLWITGSNGAQLMVWNLETVKEASDQAGINRTIVQGRSALELSVFRSVVESRWAYASISQTLDGGRLAALMNMTIGLWVFKEKCQCDADLFNGTSVILAVQTNDGVHTILYVFSDELQDVKSLPNEMILFLPTPSDVWSFENLNIASDYRMMHWGTPTELTFSIILGVAGQAVGLHSAYVGGISLSRGDFSPSQSTSSQLFVPDIKFRLNA